MCQPEPVHDPVMPLLEDGVTVVLVDVQDKLAKVMPDLAGLLRACGRMLSTARALGLDILVTEQYPQGLGATVPVLRGLLAPDTPVFTKTSFSCWGCSAFAAAVDQRQPAWLVLLGVETHVCIQQTALDALMRGYHVILPVGAIQSRRPDDHKTALNLLRGAGATITTTEALAFHLLRDASHPKLKEVATVFREL